MQSTVAIKTVLQISRYNLKVKLLCKLQTRAFTEGEDKPSFRILQTKQLERKEVSVFITEAENDVKLNAIILQLTTGLGRNLYIC